MIVDAHSKFNSFNKLKSAMQMGSRINPLFDNPSFALLLYLIQHGLFHGEEDEIITNLEQKINRMLNIP